MERLYVEKGRLAAGGVPVLLRGFGLGGWLLPEGYMWRFYTKCDRPRRIEALIEKLCGAEYAASFWERYYGSYITEADIRLAAQNGFNSVRLPFNARHLREPGYLRCIDDCVRWCGKHGVYAILDMHAAPGGQTGQNIDDSERDLPELFMRPEHRDELCALWALLAARYRGEAAVAGFDLLNEPLIRKDAEHNGRLVPLYLRITEAVRRADPERIVIWEGAHWATDFSVFDALEREDLPENLVLQFHKYWSTPDEESLGGFLGTARRLELPLYCGESGENNLDWYAAMFPLLDRLGISWSFWSYKKMATPNSVSVFPEPERWGELLDFLDGGEPPARQQEIFNDFLACIGRAEIRRDVLSALCRRPPVRIPAEAFDGCRVSGPRGAGADFRPTSPVTIIFADGHTGAPDFRRYGGEPQPESERMLVKLREGDSVTYRVACSGRIRVRVSASAPGGLWADGGSGLVSLEREGGGAFVELDGKLTLTCVSGEALLDYIEVFEL